MLSSLFVAGCAAGPDSVTVGWTQSPRANHKNYADPGTASIEAVWYFDKEGTVRD